MTDEGWHLARQWAAVTPDTHQPGMTWLAEVVGGAWLLATGKTVLGARLGWVLILVLTALVSYGTLRPWFPGRATGWLVAAAGLLAQHRGVLVLDQNLLAFLLLLGAAAALLSAERLGEYHGHWRGWALLCGGLLGLAVLARLPLAVALPLPWLTFLWASEYPERPRARRWQTAALGTVGAALVLGSAAIHLTLREAWPGYLEQVAYAAGDEHHDLLSQAALLSRQLGQSLAAVGLFVGGLLLADHVAVLCVRGWLPLGTRPSAGSLLVWRKRRAWFRAAILSGATLSLTGFICGLRWFPVFLPGLFVSIGLALMWLEHRRSAAGETPRGRLPLLMLAALLPFWIALGAGNGLGNMRHGLWLVAPCAILILPETLASFGGRRRALPAEPADASLTVTAVLGALLLVALMHRAALPYRDDWNRLRLTAGLNHPRLTGVHTTQGRAASVDALLREVEARLAPDDELLAYNSIPLLYFLTDTRPALGHPWPVQWSADEIARRLARLETEGRLPALAVRAIVNTRDPRWATGPTEPERPETLARLAVLDEFLVRHGYREVWANREFRLLARQ